MGFAQGVGGDLDHGRAITPHHPARSLLARTSLRAVLPARRAKAFARIQPEMNLGTSSFQATKCYIRLAPWALVLLITHWG